MSTSPDTRYRAFISYSHRDAYWARWLHRSLESFKIPIEWVGRETAAGPLPSTLRPVFKDRDDFAAGRTLELQTLEALDESDALILICSPASAQSQFVNEEVRLFKHRHPDRPILPIIVSGNPAGTDQCFPEALIFKLNDDGSVSNSLESVPLAADVREECDGLALALSKIIAGLLGIGADEVFRRSERASRLAAKRRFRVLSVILLSLFSAIAVLVGWTNQVYLLERLNWLVYVRPFIAEHVSGQVLDLQNEKALKPGDSFFECSNNKCPDMVVLPPGKFMMGAPSDENFPSEMPQREVAITKAIAVGRYEVTFEEWDACAIRFRCPPAVSSKAGRGRQPVLNVSWEGAKKYVEWLSLVTGKQYRLLTEAEWEYSARARLSTRYPSGSTSSGLGEYAWFNGNSDFQTHQVGLKKPNNFGLYDFSGNVSEWVEDVWSDSYRGAPSDGSPRLDGDQRIRVIRGGAWLANELAQRLSYRYPRESYYAGDFALGFRVARNLQ